MTDKRCEAMTHEVVAVAFELAAFGCTTRDRFSHGLPETEFRPFIMRELEVNGRTAQRKRGPLCNG
jgi:hypothetical protein